MAKPDPVKAPVAAPAISEAEVRAEFAKMKERRDAQRAKYAEYSQRPDVKARQAEYSAKAKARRKAIVEAAAKLGLTL
jgi:hypothetical protein